jgi:hypothetical protein
MPEAVRIAIVQDCPVPFDLQATVGNVEQLTSKAANRRSPYCFPGSFWKTLRAVLPGLLIHQKCNIVVKDCPITNGTPIHCFVCGRLSSVEVMRGLPGATRYPDASSIGMPGNVLSHLS